MILIFVLLRLFSLKYHVNQIRNLVAEFNESGLVVTKKRRIPRIANEVLGEFAMNPNLSGLSRQV